MRDHARERPGPDSPAKPWMRLVRKIYCALLLSAACGGFCGAAAAQGESPSPPAMLPWLSLDTSQPLVLRFNHDIQYDPAIPKITVRKSEWSIERLRLAFFGGGAGMTGRGSIAESKATSGTLDSDVATTITLSKVDIQEFLKFVQLPRAEEIEARVSGSLYVRVVRGDWAAFNVRLTTEPKSVRLSRGLIVQLLGGSLSSDEIHSRVDPVLNGTFGSAQMIPVDSMTIKGNLGSGQLDMNIPIRNEVLNIDFEPHIDRALLWQAWEYLKNAGIKDVKSIKIQK